ncbi:unnamed protein product, partial [Prorocentrum cordatum]
GVARRALLLRRRRRRGILDGGRGPPIPVAEQRAVMGVEREVIEEGDGRTYPKRGDVVTIHYTGRLSASGQKFDSSLDRGRPFETEIGVGRVIRGWDAAVPLMSLGEKAKLRISSDFAYGSTGIGGGMIPPNSDLEFEVELLKISSPGAAGPGRARRGGGPGDGGPADAGPAGRHSEGRPRIRGCGRYRRRSGPSTSATRWRCTGCSPRQPVS